MRTTIATLAAVIFATAAPAQAQTRDVPSYLQRPTTISVQYTLRLPLKSDDLAEQQEVMETGRKRLYEIGGRECANLLATLATSCTLSSLNVQSNFYRQGREDNAVTVSANAKYQIDLKTTNSEPAALDR